MVAFSLAGYNQLLAALADEGYSFCRYEEIDTRLAAGDPFVVLRHDIDISLRPALEIARLEHERGVQATYFVLLRSPFYNVLSRANAEIMSQIHRYGHQIATHVDLTFYNNDCAKALGEIETFARCYPFIDPDLVTLHSPYDLHRIPIDLVPELNRVYGSAIKGDVAYISDSTGRWRYGTPLESEAFKTRKPMQLLTHPIWWVQEGETARQKLERWLHVDYQDDLVTLKEFLPKLYTLNEP
ncbi:MAG TPA: hypothetical protein VGN34_14725 [Ktedonobacteraceae bacterium]|jgi:hypothetical protein